MDSALSDEFEVNVVLYQGSMLSPYILDIYFIFYIVDIVAQFVREGVLSELLYVDDLVLMSETIDGLRNKVLKCKEALES